MKMLRKTLCAMTVGVVTLGPVMSSTVFAAPVAASEQQSDDEFSETVEWYSKYQF